METHASLPLHIRLLGGFTITAADGTDLTPPGKKLRALIACLALPPGTTWSREKLTALLWGDREEEQARGSLRQALAELRRNLGEGVLLADRETIAFDPASVRVDAVEFDGLARTGQLAEASGLYRGDLLDRVNLPDAGFGDWLQVERTRLHDLGIDVLRRLAESQSDSSAITTAQRLLELEPAHEWAHRVLMRLYGARGDRAQALRQYQLCRDILRQTLDVEPDAETDRLFKGIQAAGNGRGRENTPAHPYATPSDPAAIALTSNIAPSIRPRVSWHWPAIVILIAAIAAGAAGWRLHPWGQQQPRSFPSMAVLPFQNLSGDPALDSLGDGVTGDAITALSHFSDLTVVSRDSTLAYKGRTPDPTQVGRELKVDYVLEGSLQRKGDKLRITVQLVDTATNLHVWAEGFDGGDAAALQDEVVRNIMVSLPGDRGAIRSNEYERTKNKATVELDEYGFFLRGTELMFAAETVADHDRGGAILREGLKKFPDSPLLRVMLAAYHFRRPWDFGTSDAATDYRLAGEFARAALASPNPSRFVQWRGRKLMAYIHWTEGDFVRAVADAEAAVALNPNDADTLSFLSRVQIAAGNPARAIEWVQESTRLDPTIWRNTRILAWAYYLTGAYQQSIEAANAHERLTRAFPADAHLYLAVDYVRLGRLDEARAAINKLLEMEPQWTQATEREWNATWPYKDSAVFERYLADLGQAGLPEK